LLNIIATFLGVLVGSQMLSMMTISNSPAPVLLAVCRGLKVFGRLVAADRLLEARELDDDEAVEFSGPSRILNLPPRARNLPPNFPMIAGARSAYFLY
jgi:hypothetical protein